MSSQLRTPQFWLAELDEYGNAKLNDGPHGSVEGVNKAAYIIHSLGLGGNRRYAVAKVELTECVPSDKGVNHDAIREIQRAKRRVGGGR